MRSSVSHSSAANGATFNSRLAWPSTIARGSGDMALSHGPDWSQRYTTAELDLMYTAWLSDAPLASHDVRWAKATLELCLAIDESARERKEVLLGHQVPFAHERG